MGSVGEGGVFWYGLGRIAEGGDVGVGSEHGSGWWGGRKGG